MSNNNPKIRAFLKRYKLPIITLFVSFLFLSAFMLSGCDELPNVNINTESDTQTEEDATPPEDNQDQQEQETEDPVEEEDQEEPPEEEPEEEELEEGTVTVNIYYADPQGEHLIGEARTFPAGSKHVDAVYELMKEPIDSSLIRLIPDTTKINSITVEDGNAIVDLSQEFLDDRFQSDTVDILLIYSIVNTLTEFDDINSIEFYINGEKLDILGQLDVSDPIYRRSDLIK